MIFSSPVFLFLFLPVVLLAYFAGGRRLRNGVLLIASLLFYSWGEREVVLVMISSILGNFGFGIWAERSRASGGRLAVATAVVFNIGLLVAYKYANWIWAGLSSALATLGLSDEGLPPIARVFSPALEAIGIADSPLPEDWSIRLPIGISFFTFQALSYVIDVYRGQARVQRNPVHFGVYISLFPQLIAGPIVRYKDVAEQILTRVVTVDGFAWGVRRFVLGLAKKILVANTVAQTADSIFGLPTAQLSPAVAWLGIVCYAIQIYFDFSGYSDMAIGLGRMLGFRFLENFNFPYISTSITEFWRRWHISLSTWFRDYLYIPLGGNRKGPARTYVHLVTVFFLCGLWHGASASFIVWGLYHGLFLVFERLGLGDFLAKRHASLRHAYTLVVVLVGWVFFRAESLGHAIGYLTAMAGLQEGGLAFPFLLHWNTALALGLLAGVLGSMPIVPLIVRWRERQTRRLIGVAYEGSALVLLAVLFFAVALELAAGSYNPFIYFRF